MPHTKAKKTILHQMVFICLYTNLSEKTFVKPLKFVVISHKKNKINKKKHLHALLPSVDSLHYISFQFIFWQVVRNKLKTGKKKESKLMRDRWNILAAWVSTACKEWLLWVFPIWHIPEIVCLCVCMLILCCFFKQVRAKSLINTRSNVTGLTPQL